MTAKSICYFLVTAFIGFISFQTSFADSKNQGISDMRPFLSIPQIKSPSIDGVLEEKEWEFAAQAKNFLLLDGTKLATEQTLCILGYDSTHLYVALRMEAYALDPASNQRHTFKANLTEKQSYVWEDDAVELRMSLPSNPYSLFYVGVNANAATYCAILEYDKSSLGFKGFTAWNPDDIKVAARIYDGFWTVELAIPLDIAAEIGKNESYGRLSISRHEKRLGETSAWSNLNGTLMVNMAPFGMYCFRADAPVVRLPNMPQWHAGDNKIKLGLLDASQFKAQLESIVYDSSGKNTAATSKVDLQPKKLCDVTQNIRIKDPHKARLQFLVSDDKGKLLYRTEALPGSSPAVKKIIPTLKFKGAIKGDGPIELFVNGKRNILSEDTKIILTPTANMLAMYIPPHTSCKGTLSVGDQKFPFGHGWKCSQKVLPNWYAPDFNDSEWKRLDTNELTTAEEGLYLRRLLLVDAAETFPQFIDNTFNLTLGGTYAFKLSEHGRAEPLPPQLKNAEIILDLPKGLTLFGVCSQSGKISRVPASQWRDENLYSWTDQGHVEKEGQTYTRYCIKRKGKMKFSTRKPTWADHYDMPIIAIHAGSEAEQWTPETIKDIFFHIQSDDGYITEVDNVLRVRVLPKLDGKMPKKICLNLGAGIRIFHFPADDEIAIKLAETLKQAGINQLQYWGYADIEGNTGIPTYAFFRYTTNKEPDNLVQMDKVLECCEHRKVWQNGFRHPRAPVIAEIIDNPKAREAYKQAIRDYCKRFPHQRIVFDDFEYPSYTTNPKRIPSVWADFSPYSLERFRKAKNISEPVTVELIGKKYLDEWVDYNTTLVAEMMKLTSEVVHECGRVFMTYSGYHNNHTINSYTFDYDKIAPAADIAMAGYGRPIDDVIATRKALAGKPLVGGLLSVPGGTVIHPPAQILRRILDCGGGVLIWREDSYDALALSEIAEVSKFVAKYEDFLVKGIPAKDIVTSPVKDAVIVRRLNNQAIVMILNEKRTADKIPCKFSSNIKNILNVQSGKPVELSESKDILVPAGNFVALFVELKDSKK